MAWMTEAGSVLSRSVSIFKFCEKCNEIHQHDISHAVSKPCYRYILYNDETKSSGRDYHMLLITVSQSSEGESLMHSSKSLIDSTWPSHQSLPGCYLFITEVLFPTSSPRYTRQAISKQNHGPMQKVTGEGQLQSVWPLTVPPAEISNAVQSRQQAHSTQDEPDTAVTTGNMPIPEHQRTQRPQVG